MAVDDDVRWQVIETWRHSVQSNESDLRKRFPGLQVDKIDPYVVYERDRGRCQVCDESVNLLVREPDPLAKTLGHIVLPSSGGPHTLDNVQLEHKTCNSRKPRG